MTTTPDEPQYLSALPYDPTDRKPPRGTPQVIDLGPTDPRFDRPDPDPEPNFEAHDEEWT